MEIIAERDTALKREAKDSSLLPTWAVVKIPKGTKFLVHSATKGAHKHYRVALLTLDKKPAKLGPKGYNTWFLYAPHWDLDDIEQEEKDVKSKVLEKVQNHKLVNPNIDWSNFNQPISQHFVVGEVTHYESRRIPKQDHIKRSAINLAKQLDALRKAYGQPLFVTSWYRPPAVNKAVGGATRSSHLSGQAVDVYPKDGSVSKFQSYCINNWYGEVGLGARYRGFVHLGMRNGKGFKTGGSKGARWNY